MESALRHLICAIALTVGCSTAAAAISPNDPAATYYDRCVAPSRGATVPNQDCDGAINAALTGIIVGQFDQERPAFCYPRNLVDKMQGIERDRRHRPGRLSDQASRASSRSARRMLIKMRAAVAHYMREHSERLSESTLEVIMAALLHAFPCPD